MHHGVQNGLHVSKILAQAQPVHSSETPPPDTYPVVYRRLESKAGISPVIRSEQSNCKLRRFMSFCLVAQWAESGRTGRTKTRLLRSSEKDRSLL